MTDVLLVKPYSGHIVIPPLGLGYLAAALKRSGFSSRILDCGRDRLEIEDVAEIIRRELPRVVGVTCCSNDHPWLARLAAFLDDLPELPLVAGGAHPTGLRGRLFELIPRLSYLVASEGELALPRLVEVLMNGGPSDSALEAIPNLIWKDGAGRVQENPVEMMKDLDSLGMPDWEQIAPGSYSEFAPHGGFALAQPVAQLMTTRGCPYPCSYCAGGLIHGRTIRRRSADSILDEIEYLQRVHRAREFHFEDDNFTFRRDHVLELCSGIRERGIKARFALPNGVRLDKLDEEILRELRSAGFYTFSLGIESGSSETLRRMRKRLDLGSVREKIGLIRSYGFLLKGYFILGYPGESREDVQKTIDFACSLRLDRAYFTMFIPLPGTRDFEMLEQEGKIELSRLDWENFFTKGDTNAPFTPDAMTSGEVEQYSHLAYRRFYMRPEIILSVLKDLRVTSVPQLFEIIRNVARRNLSYFI